MSRKPSKPINALIQFWGGGDNSEVSESSASTPEKSQQKRESKTSESTQSKPTPPAAAFSTTHGTRITNDPVVVRQQQQTPIEQRQVSEFSDNNDQSTPLKSEPKVIPQTEETGLSIIEIQTLTQKNEKGRMDWSSLSKSESDPLSTKSSSSENVESPKSNSIIKIQTISKLNEKGRMDWSSLPKMESGPQEESSTTKPPVLPKDVHLALSRKANAVDSASQISPSQKSSRVSFSSPLNNRKQSVSEPAKPVPGYASSVLLQGQESLPISQQTSPLAHPSKPKPNPIRVTLGNSNDFSISEKKKNLPHTYDSELNTNIQNPDSNEENDRNIYKVVVGSKGYDLKKKSHVPSAQETNSFMLEMNETANITGTSSTNNKSKTVASDNDHNTTNELIRTISQMLNQQTAKDNVGSTSYNNNGNDEHVRLKSQKRNPRVQTLSKTPSKLVRQKTVLGPRPYSLRRAAQPPPTAAELPRRNTLSPANTLKNVQGLSRAVSTKSQLHDLPEYTSSKAKLSLLVPHKLANLDYGKENHSVPDLTARHRQQVSDTFYKKPNQTVPDFTRIGMMEKVPEHALLAIDDNDIDLGKVTKFSIDPFNESETNELFKPGAPWIDLPKLDRFISSLPKTEFSKPKDVMTEDEYQKFVGHLKFRKTDMFPPMNQIPEGITLENLKSNITKSENVRNQGFRNDVISTGIDGVLGAQSAYYSNTTLKFEIFRDFFQFLSLALSFATPNAFGNWLNTLLNTIPNLLSLNFSTVFGNGVAFFLVFCVIAFGSLYWFKMMTKYDPNADVEGFEAHPWSLRPESSRRRNIFIVFAITSIYLPLSKLSIDALVWSDTYWAVANPYNGTDYPTLVPIGPSDVYRDPGDFCYVTSMKKADLNFAFIIIAVAIVTLAFVTIWFPIALKRLVDKNLPKVDNYTESGERKDPEQEYKEQLENDICPYNFLYNGYSRRWGAYKTFIMANKLFVVLLVEVISKDNCLLRSYPRMRVETIRECLQIGFMVLLLLLHWQTQPFILHSQNISEYFSRFGYVINSSLGMLIVLQIGSAHATGVVTTIVTFLVGVALVWYVVRESDRFQSILKAIKQRLDFSLNIYSPRLDLTKHIKRRIWQETWTTLFLVGDQFKMPEGKIVAFSESPHRPPYLLNFGGSVAERHVENLTIMRQIGLRHYTSSTAPLPASLAVMRLRIVNKFVGPDMYYAPELMMPNLKTYFGKAYVVPFPFSVVMVYDEDDTVVTLTKEWEIGRYLQQNEDKEIERRRTVRQMLRALEGKDILDTSQQYVDNCHRGLLTIQRKKRSKWRGKNMNPGFEVTITYTNSGDLCIKNGARKTPHERTVGHEALGIETDFSMTPQLEKLFADNSELVEEGLIEVRQFMKEYREFYRDEAQRKAETLSYAFFVNIYDHPSIPMEALPALLMTTEENPKIQEIPETDYPALIYLYERIRVVNLSILHQWWFLFWDDLWRKNAKEIPSLYQHPHHFSPAYQTSICYRPMTRFSLEQFLEKHGFWKKKGKTGFLHSGILNRIYLHMNNLVFNSGHHNRRKLSSATSNVSDTTNRTKMTNGGSIVLGRVRWTWRERVFQAKDAMLGRPLNPRTRPFFIIQEPLGEHESDDNESYDQSDDSSDDEIWW